MSDTIESTIIEAQSPKINANANPNPPQFLIGGATGSAGVGSSGVRIQDESVHPLQKLNPDAWNNIPICLVKAVKTLIDANISTDQRMRNLQGQTENNVRKAVSHIQKVEKDLLKKEEQLKGLIERTDKNLNAALAIKSNEIDGHIKALRDSLHELNLQT